MNGRRRGKDHERAVARRLGGTRIGVTGRAGCDVAVQDFAIECKERASLPAWLVGAAEQAERNAGGRMPVVILHQFGEHHARDLVVMRLAVFERLVNARRVNDEYECR